MTGLTGELATQGYNGRGLPYDLNSSSGIIVTGTTYNNLALPIQIDLNNNTRTTYGYWLETSVLPPRVRLLGSLV